MRNAAIALSPSIIDPAAAVAIPGAAAAVAIPGAADVPALIALINHLADERSQLFIQPVDPASGVAALRAHLAAIAESHDEAVLVARDGAELVGLITGIRGSHPARRGTVDIGLGVRSTHRGRGIGFALMVALEAWARGQGCNCLQLRVAVDNAPAIALYRKAGFTVEGKLRATVIVDGRTLDELQMGKLLAATR